MKKRIFNKKWGENSTGKFNKQGFIGWSKVNPSDKIRWRRLKNDKNFIAHVKKRLDNELSKPLDVSLDMFKDACKGGN